MATKKTTSTDKKSKKTIAKKATSTSKKSAAVSTTASPVAATAEASVKKTAIAKQPIDQNARARKWNFGFAAVFIAQAAAVIMFAKDARVPVTTSYQAVDKLATDVSSQETFASAIRHLADVPVAWVVAAFLLVFAVSYVLSATVWRSRYEAAIARGVSVFRWATLALGGGAMLVAISLLSGVHDVSMLALLFGSMAAGCFAALAGEKLVADNNGVKTRTSHLMCGLSVLGTVLPWVVLAVYVVGASVFDGKVPVYMWGVYASTLVLFAALALTTRFSMLRKGKWANNVYTEQTYMLLGAAAASLLAWQIFAGVLQP